MRGCGWAQDNEIYVEVVYKSELFSTTDIFVRLEVDILALMPQAPRRKRKPGFTLVSPLEHLNESPLADS
jgi:hypothetical protein